MSTCSGGSMRLPTSIRGRAGAVVPVVLWAAATERGARSSAGRAGRAFDGRRSPETSVTVPLVTVISFCSVNHDSAALVVGAVKPRCARPADRWARVDARPGAVSSCPMTSRAAVTMSWRWSSGLPIMSVVDTARTPLVSVTTRSSVRSVMALR
ncbi:hypothetical protein [Mycobacteroides abscessus]|uniref:hypothetical protein n=1 Tax=Mycobacteroides abscessus TaxID=36809 RepID=UPI001041CDE5|nr:hypothetical protein [Mycobacteroides abscessus]